MLLVGSSAQAATLKVNTQADEERRCPDEEHARDCHRFRVFAPKQQRYDPRRNHVDGDRHDDADEHRTAERSGRMSANLRPCVARHRRRER